MTKRLFLEYCDKAEPSYTSLMQSGGHCFQFCGAQEDDATQVCAVESDWMAVSAVKLKSALKKLETISTVAFLGGQREIWKPIWDSRPFPYDMGERMKAARGAISSLSKSWLDPFILDTCLYV
jgi:hypothetical protein